jgi:hypothetical protein
MYFSENRSLEKLAFQNVANKKFVLLKIPFESVVWSVLYWRSTYGAWYDAYRAGELPRR